MDLIYENGVKLLNGKHNSSPVIRLRAATYLAPSFPAEYFEAIIFFIKLFYRCVYESIKLNSLIRLFWII